MVEVCDKFGTLNVCTGSVSINKSSSSPAAKMRGPNLGGEKSDPSFHQGESLAHRKLEF